MYLWIPNSFDEQISSQNYGMYLYCYIEIVKSEKQFKTTINYTYSRFFFKPLITNLAQNLSQYKNNKSDKAMPYFRKYQEHKTKNQCPYRV